MDYTDSIKIIGKMEKLWPDWAPNDAQAGNLTNLFVKFDEPTAIKAINAAVFESNFKTPPLKTIASFLRQFRPTKHVIGEGGLPDPKYYIQYSGGGSHSLVAGYFVPIYSRIGFDDYKQAETTRDMLFQQFGGYEDGGGEWNRMDDYEVEFHKRVRAGYHEMIAAEPQRWMEIDGSQSPEAVQKELQQAVISP